PSSSNTSSESSSFQISPPPNQSPSSFSLLDDKLGSLEASPVILCLDSSELRAAEENIHPALTAFCLPAGITPVPSALTSAKPRSFALDSPLFRSLSPTLPTSQSPSGSDISLTSVFVPLEAIKPSKANK
uniref:Golgi associated, gamma adaptin ear containing, ARF binding protein 3a n=1 Tax=Cyprinus carpio carpio TaxID=630221 RepID=A0A9J7Y5Q5_CYPCA